jgi:hypothetical protein
MNWSGLKFYYSGTTHIEDGGINDNNLIGSIQYNADLSKMVINKASLDSCTFVGTELSGSSGDYVIGEVVIGENKRKLVVNAASSTIKVV